MDQCNSCENGRCRLVMDFRKGNAEVPVYQYRQMLSGECPRHRVPSTFKIPLLKLALAEHPQEAYEFMRQYNLRLVQRGMRFSIKWGKGKRK